MENLGLWYNNLVVPPIAYLLQIKQRSKKIVVGAKG
jgi:hypothetical protein